MTMLSNIKGTMLIRYLPIRNLYNLFCILVVIFACGVQKTKLRAILSIRFFMNYTSVLPVLKVFRYKYIVVLFFQCK